MRNLVYTNYNYKIIHWYLFWFVSSNCYVVRLIFNISFNAIFTNLLFVPSNIYLVIIILKFDCHDMGINNTIIGIYSITIKAANSIIYFYMCFDFALILQDFHILILSSRLISNLVQSYILDSSSKYYNFLTVWV